MKISIAFILLAACAANPATTNVSRFDDTLWLCSSVASCDGEDTTELHELCARPSREDVLVPGDIAAQDWTIAWLATCEIDQGNVNDPGRTCTTSTGQPTPSHCYARCFPQFTNCTP